MSNNEWIKSVEISLAEWSDEPVQCNGRVPEGQTVEHKYISSVMIHVAWSDSSGNKSLIQTVNTVP